MDISQSQQKIITELMNGVIHHSEPINKLIQASFDAATTIAINGVIAGGAELTLATQSAIGVKATVLGGISSTAITTIAITSAVTIGLASYYAYVAYQDQQRWYRDISHETSMAMFHIAACLKEEYLDRNDYLMTAVLPNFREHPALMSYIHLKNMDILKQEDKGIVYEKKKKEYKEQIEKYIQPDKLQDFEREMRLYCAGNKVLSDANYHKGHYKTASMDYAGEFHNSKPQRHSVAWEARELQKQKMGGKQATDWAFAIKQSVCEMVGSASQPVTMFNDGFAFKQVRDKFYGAYKALTFALYNNINNDNLESQIIAPYNEFLKLAIKPECMDQFKEEFRQYRYYGGSCEFDAEEIFKMKLFNNYYTSLENSTQKNFVNSDNSINWKYQAKRQAIIAGITGGLTLVGGAIKGWAQHNNAVYHKALNNANNQCQAGLNTGNEALIRENCSLNTQVQNGFTGAETRLNEMHQMFQETPVSYSEYLGEHGATMTRYIVVDANITNVAEANALQNCPKVMLDSYQQCSESLFFPTMSRFSLDKQSQFFFTAKELV